MKELLNQFIELSITHRKQLKSNPENYKINNKLAKEINLIGDEIEQNESFILDYLDILENYPSLGGIIGIRLRDYDMELAKKIYEDWYNTNPDENWQGKFILSDWDQYQKNNNNIKTLNYNNWKENNRDYYERVTMKLKKIQNLLGII